MFLSLQWIKYKFSCLWFWTLNYALKNLCCTYGRCLLGRSGQLTKGHWFKFHLGFCPVSVDESHAISHHTVPKRLLLECSISLHNVLHWYNSISNHFNYMYLFSAAIRSTNYFSFGLFLSQLPQLKFMAFCMIFVGNDSTAVASFCLAFGLWVLTELLSQMTNSQNNEVPVLVCCYLFWYSQLTSISRNHSTLHCPSDTCGWRGSLSQLVYELDKENSHDS